MYPNYLVRVLNQLEGLLYWFFDLDRPRTSLDIVRINLDMHHLPHRVTGSFPLHLSLPLVAISSTRAWPSARFLQVSDFGSASYL